MLFIFVDRLDSQTSLLQHFFELRLRAFLRFCENHLAAGERVHFSIALHFDRSVQQVRILSDHVCHRANRHRVRHARVRRKLADHVRLFVMIGIERLANQHVPFAAAQLKVIERLGKILQFHLVRQFVGDVCQRFAEPVVGANVEALEPFEDQVVPLGMLAGGVTMFQLADNGVHQIVQPHRDRRRHDLGVFLLQPLLNVVIAVAFVSLQPELAGDFHASLHPSAVDFDGVPLLADFL